MPGAVVGHDKVQVLDDGGGYHLFSRREPQCNELVAAGLTGLAQGVVAGQRRLAVQIQQQDP
ncbi:hypothetical protein D3C78_1802560 [compost metagenome]